MPKKNISKTIETVKPYIPPAPSYEKEEPAEIIVHEIVTRVDEPKPLPKHGLFLGIYDRLPTIGYDFDGKQLEIGYLNDNGDQQGLIKGAIRLTESKDGYSLSNIGVIFLPGVANSPNLGAFVGVEQFVAPNISLTGDIVALAGNNKSIVPRGTFGAKIKF